MVAGPRLRASAWAVLLLAVVSLAEVVSAGNLYPACGGKEYRAQATTSTAGVVAVLSQTTPSMTLSCLAFEVTSVLGGSGGRAAEDHCAVRNQTEYRYRFVIRAEYSDAASGEPKARDFDVRDIGGSVNNIAIRVPAAGKVRYSLILINTAANHRCILSARAIMSVNYPGELQTPVRVPTLIGAFPRTIFVKNSEYTTFYLRHESSALARASNGSLVLVKSHIQCAAATATNSFPLLPKDTPDLGALYLDQRSISTHKFFFDEPGSFRLCYLFPTITVEIAMITAYGGNPAYYEIIDGADEQGRVSLFKRTTIKFTGANLDTRRGGDTAKFVNDEDDCATGEPAGGVIQETDLGPADDYGPETTYTTWTWRLRHMGIYKVCYRRRQGGWSEVPNINDIGPGAIDQVGPGWDSIPTPIDPVTKKECPMAPKRTPETPWVTHRSLKLTLATTDFQANFFDSMSRFFCVPRSALSITRTTHNQKGQQVVFLAFLCEDIDGVNGKPCDSQERVNYGVFLSANAPDTLAAQGIATIEGSSQLFTTDDDSHSDSAKRNHFLTVLVICVTAIVVAGLGVLGVIKYRENKHYFIQFGQDDGDFGDMYGDDDFDGGAGVEVTGGDKSSRGHLRNATIELEL